MWPLRPEAMDVRRAIEVKEALTNRMFHSPLLRLETPEVEESLPNPMLLNFAPSTTSSSVSNQHVRPVLLSLASTSARRGLKYK